MILWMNLDERGIFCFLIPGKKTLRGRVFRYPLQNDYYDNKSFLLYNVSSESYSVFNVELIHQQFKITNHNLPIIAS